MYTLTPDPGRYLKVKDDIPALILAVLLAAGVAYYTLIPLALGNLTTALNSLNSYSHGTFLGTIRHPALQLLKYYCFHVSVLNSLFRFKYILLGYIFSILFRWYKT